MQKPMLISLSGVVGVGWSGIFNGDSQSLQMLHNDSLEALKRVLVVAMATEAAKSS